MKVTWIIGLALALAIALSAAFLVGRIKVINHDEAESS